MIDGNKKGGLQGETRRFAESGAGALGMAVAVLVRAL